MKRNPLQGESLSRFERSHTLVALAAACAVVIGVSMPAESTSALTTEAASPSASSSSRAATTSPTNLLTGRQATFAGTTGGWIGENSTVSWTQMPSTLSTGSLVMTATATSWVVAESPQVTATPGVAYTGAASIDSGSSATVGDGLAFYNSSGVVIAAVWGQTTMLASSTWTTLPEVAGVAPSTASGVALMTIAWTASVGQDLYVDSPLLASAPNTAAPGVVGPLHTSGNQIIQANGEPVTLQGLVLTGLESNGTLAASGITEQSIIEAKAWGANFVRVPLGEQFWLPSNCDYSSSYESAVDQVVNWITSLGMVALLDLHTNTVGGCEAGTQHNMADATQSPKFWSEVAQRYGNPSSAQYNPLVAFDLYNEPHNITNAVWLDGGQTTDVYAPYQSYEAAGMQQLYDAVRSTGAQNLVFISGNNWANTPPTQLVSGDDIVYAVHYYTCSTSPPPSEGGTCSTPDPYNPSQDLDLWVALSATQPVVITEFGWPDQSDGTYLANVIAFAQAHDWGWSAWQWQQQNGPFVFESWLSDGTAEPTISGVPVLLALSGTS